MPANAADPAAYYDPAAAPPISLAEDGWSVRILDQTLLPHRVEWLDLKTVDQAAEAIRAMRVRGAPLIGAAAAFGLCLGLRDDPTDTAIERICAQLLATRPTAVNLAWALDEMRRAVADAPTRERMETAYRRAEEIRVADIAVNRAIGEYGLEIVKRLAAGKPAGAPVDILTHCNAGYLATCGWGTATAPIYLAQTEGVAVHVWIDETRPRNQGAALTAWELGEAGVPHTVIADNAGGHLMQRGQIDMAITGTDRTTASGDVCNKIGTYLKALAAMDCGVPFYVALPSSTIDWSIADGMSIPIEERAATEVTRIQGVDDDGAVREVTLTPPGSAAANPAFDVTPARLIAGLITERGVSEASAEGLRSLFPERSAKAAE